MVTELTTAKEIGQRIRTTYEAKGHTRDSFAKVIGLAPNSLWRYVAGRSRPRARTLKRIAHALDVSETFLLTGLSPGEGPWSFAEARKLARTLRRGDDARFVLEDLEQLARAVLAIPPVVLAQVVLDPKRAEAERREAGGQLAFLLVLTEVDRDPVAAIDQVLAFQKERREIQVKPALICDEDDLRRVVRDEVRNALGTRETPAPVYLTTAAAAKRIGCNPQTLTRWAKRGVVPSHRLGRALRFRPEDLDAWLANGKVK